VFEVHMAIEVWTPWCRSHVTSTPCCFSGIALALALRADHPRDLGGEFPMVFQAPLLFLHMSIGDNVAFGLRMRRTG